MRFLLIALMFSLWQGDAARASSGRAASLVRQHLTTKAGSIAQLEKLLLGNLHSGLNAGAGEKVRIGIDLGTTNSAVVLSLDGGATTDILQISADKRTMPSVVSLVPGKEGVGDFALNMRSVSPLEIIFSIKRFMGKRLSEIDQEIIDSLPYEIVADANGWAVVKIGDKTYTPVEISARILSELKRVVEEQGYEVEAAVITIPAYFDDAQRQATLDAGKIAELNVDSLLTEPTAAALAHGFKDGKILVFDLGGGTFDVSVLNMDDFGDGTYAAEVKATGGNSTLGGDNFDERIIEYLVESIKKDSGVDVSNDASAMAILRDEAKKTKELLSEGDSVDINIPFVTFNQAKGQPIRYSGTLTRARFDDMIRDLVDKTIAETEKTLAEAKLTPADIGGVVPVGGSIRTRLVMEMLENIFGEEKISRRDNPDEAVAFGAGLKAGIAEEGSGIVLVDVTPLSLGIGLEGGGMGWVMKKNTTIPTDKKETFTTVRDNQPDVDIEVYQGESETTAGNKLIGSFKLRGIAPAPAKVPQIEVTFSMDSNGILTVTAKDTKTGSQESITIEGSGSLSEAEIEELRQKEAEHAEQAEQLEELNKQLNQLDELIIGTENVLKDNSDKFDQDAVEELQSGINGAKSALEKAQSQRSAGQLEQASKTVSNALEGFEEMVHEETEKMGTQTEAEGEQQE